MCIENESTGKYTCSHAPYTRFTSVLKEGSDALAKPLSELFNLSLQQQHFPSSWKVANVVPVFKKADPKKVENYRPLSLLSIIGKVFEKCVYKHLHNFIVANNIITPHQSGFTIGDSTVNQLLYLSNEFSKALDDGKEIRVVFFDISKAFDRVWHKGLIYKLQNIGITGSLLLWIENYLFSRKQKVLLNGKESVILSINAGVPQGSILGPLFFLIFINDIVAEVGCSIKLFADDTSIYVIIENAQTDANNLNENLTKIQDWSNKWLVRFNPQKTETLLISRKQSHINHPTLFMDTIPIQEVKSHKHLGLTFNSTCQWGEHIDIIFKKASDKLNILRSLKFHLDRKSLQTMYFSFIRPVIEYADIIWDNCPNIYKEKLEKINIEAARIVTGGTKLTSLRLLYQETGWPTLEKRREEHKLIQYFKMVKGLTPEYLTNLIPRQHFDNHMYNTRNTQNFVSINCSSTYHFNSFLPSCVRLWNNLPLQVKEMNSIQSFKQTISHTREIPKYFLDGSRDGQIVHARLRMECSSLRHHLYLKNIEANPLCTCGEVESTSHFLLYCPQYQNQRQNLRIKIGIPLSLNLLLYGDSNLSYETNRTIFLNVQEYIKNTKRF